MGRAGDILEIILRNSTYDKYFHGKANIHSKEEMRLLESSLNEKGIAIKLPI